MGLASGMDCTIWSSALRPSVIVSVVRRTAVKRCIRSRVSGCDGAGTAITSDKLIKSRESCQIEAERLPTDSLIGYMGAFWAAKIIRQCARG